MTKNDVLKKNEGVQLARTAGIAGTVVKTIIVATVASIFLSIPPSANAIENTQAESDISNGKLETQFIDLRIKYDEKLKTLEDRVLLLSEKDQEIRKLLETLVSATNITDFKLPVQSVTGTATQAISVSNEAVKNMERFYTTIGTYLGMLIAGITIILTAIGLVGGILGYKQVKQAA